MNLALRCVALTSLAALGSCKRSAPEPAGPATAPAVSRPAATPRPAPEAKGAGPVDLASAARAANDFGFDLWRAAAPAGGAATLSPWSVNQALAMASAGARGATEAAMVRALRRPGDSEAWHAALGELEQALSSRGAGRQGSTGAFRLRSFNQHYVDRRFSIEPEYARLLQSRYRAAQRALDFAGAPEQARSDINRDVGKATEGLIPQLLPPGSVDQATASVLVNAIYFNAAWAARFDPRSTSASAFFREDGTRAEVPLMSATGIRARVSGRTRPATSPPAGKELPPLEGGDGLEVLQLPYDGGEVSLVVLLPPRGRLRALEAELTAARLDELLARPAVAATADVMLPRLEVRTPLDLRRPLEALGLGPALSPSADFTGTSAVRPLFISAVLHQAVVKIDERGTEAAGATAVLRSFGSAGYESAVGWIRVDHPFLFLIRDEATGAVLFLGRYDGH